MNNVLKMENFKTIIRKTIYKFLGELISIRMKLRNPCIPHNQLRAILHPLI